VAAGGAVCLPFDDPLSTLPDTAQRILRAAITLLAEEGYQAVTLNRVADAAGVNKSTVLYSFGNKAGLIAAVVDAQIHDECLRLAADLDRVAPQDRLHGAIEGIRRLIESSHFLRGYFDILPHAFREPELRERIFSLYEWWYEQNLRWLDLGGDAGARPDALRGLGELIAAIPDGLSIQAELGPGDFDVRRPLAALELLLRNSLPQLQALAGRQGAGDQLEHTSSGESPATASSDDAGAAAAGRAGDDTGSP
jgi:AcrR family transcriptional regulator